MIMKSRFFFVLSFMMMALGLSAQSLVFHYCGGESATVTLPATVNLVDGKVVVSNGSSSVEINKDEVLTVSYRGKKGDVNGDERVDIGDVSTILGLIANGDEGEMGHAPAGVEAVDLGLPSGTKWANMNVGAETPEDYGSYFAWGETQPKDVYNWITYSYWNDSDGDGEVDSGELANLGSDIAGTEYDAATANWGSPWRMPSKEQFQELLDNTTSTWTTQNGVNGYWFTGSNGNSVFLPAAGYRWNSDLDDAGSGGYYWSSTPSGEYFAFNLPFDSGGAYWYYLGNRYGGESVRPVR